MSTDDGRNPDVSGYSDRDTPETILESKRNHRALRAALNQVPTNFRRALVLSQLAEHSLKEIAEIENCSVGTVKSRIHRGKEILRTILLRKLEAF